MKPNLQVKNKPQPVVYVHGRPCSLVEAGTMANRALNLGNLQAAVDIYNLIIAKFPNCAEAFDNRGVAQNRMGRHAEALASADQALVLKPCNVKTHINRGIALMALKRHADALKSYDEALALQPDLVEGHDNRSLVLLEMGRFDEAMASIEKSDSLKPCQAHTHNNRGDILQKMGLHPEALESFEKAIAINPENAQFHSNRGVVLEKMNHPAEALISHNQAIALRPNFAQFHINRGLTLLELEKFVEALASFDQALTLAPDDAETHNNRGFTLQKMRLHAEAQASFDRAVSLRPDFAEAHNNRGLTLLEIKRFAEAQVSFDKAIMLKPDFTIAHSNRGSALEGLKLYDEALASFDRALTLQPDHAETHHKRGLVMVNKGDMREAEKMFHKALALEPNIPDPLFILANIQKYQDTDNPVVEQIRTWLGKPDLSPDYREPLNFALGKIYDDCDRYDDAFECYKVANEIRNAAVSYDRETVQRATDALMEVYTSSFFSQTFSFASQSRSPLFIIGMPRSGTTLVASIFSNHPSIATAGELPTMGELTASLAEETETGIPHPHAINFIGPEVAARLIGTYEKRLRRDVGNFVPFVIDKHPLNVWRLGFMARLFPKARIIHCTRDPLDTCLSNYFQRFDLAYNYSFDLGNLGHFYGEYVRLMAHWRKVLPANMIEISYEDITLNTEKVIRQTLAELGLEWDERCLSPHTNPCPVETASRWQVRQPIYTRSLQRWRHYEKHLSPLKEILRINQHIVD